MFTYFRSYKEMFSFIFLKKRSLLLNICLCSHFYKIFPKTKFIKKVVSEIYRIQDE